MKFHYELIMIVVSNSSPLIALARIQRLDILAALFNEITVPTAVYNEVVAQAANQPRASILKKAPWLITRSVTNPGNVLIYCQRLIRERLRP